MLGSVQAGVVLDAPASTVRGGRVEGGVNGIEVRAPATLSAVSVSRARDGVVVRPGGSATMTRLAVRSSRIGIRVDPGATATLTESVVDAPTAVRGELPPDPANRLSPPPPPPREFPWLAIAGMVAVSSAVAFECLAFTRERRHRRLSERTNQTAGAS